ncbi:hypothetical protein DFJ73DRAFT_808654 [Zopfochytrium polystomum]|nr:hypothetical protein DFJ73DRAFT_808654 [Zopfochytrium polystomum]
MTSFFVPTKGPAFVPCRWKDVNFGTPICCFYLIATRTWHGNVRMRGCERPFIARVRARIVLPVGFLAIFMGLLKSLCFIDTAVRDTSALQRAVMTPSFCELLFVLGRLAQYCTLHAKRHFLFIIVPLAETKQSPMPRWFLPSPTHSRWTLTQRRRTSSTTP